MKNLLEDFCKVKEVSYNDGLLEGRNIPHYEFFILRFAARRGIEIGKLSKDEIRHREKIRIEKRIRDEVEREFKGLNHTG